MLHDPLSRSGIGTVGDLQPLARLSEHHFRHVCHIIGFYGFSFLQAVPVTFLNSKTDSLVNIKFTNPVNHNAVTVTGDIVIHFKGFDPEAIHMDRMLRFTDLQTVYCKRQLRCDHPKGCHHLR